MNLLPILLASTGIACFATGCVVAPIAPLPVTPQRPFRFPNVFTAPARAIEVEAGVAAERGESVELPVTVRTGLSPNVEVFGTWSPYGQVDLPGDDGYGSGDLFLGARHRLRGLEAGLPAIAYQVEGKLATADEKRGLGSGENDLFVSAILSGYSRGVLWTGTYRLGGLGESDGTLDVEHGFAVSGTLRLRDKISVFGELVDLEQPERDRRELSVLGGARFEYARSMTFDFALVAGLSDDAPDLEIRVGLSAHLGRR